MISRKLVLLALALLLISVGIVAAQSSTNFIIHRFTMMSGGAADSASYSVHSVIGQPATGVVDSANHKVSAGFLHPLLDHKVMLPVIMR